MKKNVSLMVMLGMVLAFGLLVVGCDNGNGGDGGGGEEELLEVTHVNGFQGKWFGNLIEIEVASTTNGNQTFTLYINGMNSGTGTCTLSGGSITAIVNCTNSSLTYSGGVCYFGTVIPLRRADGTVWVHWGVYYGETMNDFNSFAQTHGRDADQMYAAYPTPDDEGYYYGSPYYPYYDTPQDIYYQARLDHPSDAPPISVLNQAIRVLNNHRNTGVGAYVSGGNLIAYYFRRNQ